MDAHEEWLAERNEAVRLQRIEREEVAERAADEARQVERQDRTEAAMHSRRLTGEPIPTHADVLARARDMLGAGDDRDLTAPYGSSARPAIWWAAADGALMEASARPAGVQRSVSEAADDDLLRQARELSGDSFMAVQVSRSERRRRGW